MKMKKLAAIAALLAVSSTALVAQIARPAGVTRADLQRHNLSVAGHEVIQARVDFEPGTRFPAHRHPGEEVIYVLEGSLEYDVEGIGRVTVNAGDVLFIPAGIAHAAANRGTVKGSELATFIVKRGQPLIKLAE